MSEMGSADKAAPTLRPVRDEDEQFLVDVYASTRADELDLTGWSDAQRESFVRMQFDAQLKHYRTHYPDADYEVILLDQEPIGRLYIARLQDETRILDITILPEYRNQKTGSKIIADLQAEALSRGRPLRIYIEHFNPSVRLFERLGFVKVGELAHNHLMEWTAQA
jgi:RimJ/RimL family protein N-acetyltransferase